MSNRPTRFGTTSAPTRPDKHGSMDKAPTSWTRRSQRTSSTRTPTTPPRRRASTGRRELIDRVLARLRKRPGRRAPTPTRPRLPGDLARGGAGFRHGIRADRGRTATNGRSAPPHFEPGWSTEPRGHRYRRLSRLPASDRTPIVINGLALAARHAQPGICESRDVDIALRMRTPLQRSSNRRRRARPSARPIFGRHTLHPSTDRRGSTAVSVRRVRRERRTAS